MTDTASITTQPDTGSTPPDAGMQVHDLDPQTPAR